jgi:hypothetical protein
LEPVKVLAAVAGPRYGDVDELETPGMDAPPLMDRLLSLFGSPLSLFTKKHVISLSDGGVFMTIRRSLENVY